MNRYALIARERHGRARPTQHRLIEDPGVFFERVGEEIGADVAALRDQLLGPMAPDESPERFRLRSYQCLATAEELTMAEHFLFQPEHPLDEDEITDEELEQDPALAGHLADLDLIERAIADFYRPDEV